MLCFKHEKEPFKLGGYFPNLNKFNRSEKGKQHHLLKKYLDQKTTGFYFFHFKSIFFNCTMLYLLPSKL